MKAAQSLANRARTSILGAIGRGAAGGVTGNEEAQLNASPIAAGTTAAFTAGAFKTATGRVRVAAQMTLSKNGGNLAAGDVVTFTLTRADLLGAIGAQERVVATTAGSDVVATATLEWIDNLAVPGTTYTYGVLASIAGGHTGGILADEAAVVVMDV